MDLLVILTAAVLGYLRVSSCLTNNEPGLCYNKFEYEYNVLQKLVEFEEKIKQQDLTNAELKQALIDTKETIKNLESKLVRTERSFDGSTYTRWGRTVCPTGATLVYDGFAAGGHYTHAGSGSNYICLPKDPVWGNYSDGFQTADRIYGIEYHTSDYSYWKNFHGQDAPCAVCRIPRNNVLMVPGRNTCDKDYKLEYSGYLMGGHYSHAGASEYVCVDDHPESLEGGHEVKSEQFFFFVQATCGVLQCPPYESTRELTCAVCSFSPRQAN
ncbi:short-chain collagen C4-like [Mercenaria mercenaria]|uniref:short-chain collagen C4-like n=1 Tax=Mercenaria mercenaria TaxID=6596 RepID=UPI001E1DFE6C|nr:short-chain collagen C4-like [Mercenaria mercenaria]